MIGKLSKEELAAQLPPGPDVLGCPYWYTIAETARLLGVKREKVKSWLRYGFIRVKRSRRLGKRRIVTQRNLKLAFRDPRFVKSFVKCGGKLVSEDAIPGTGRA